MQWQTMNIAICCQHTTLTCVLLDTVGGTPHYYGWESVTCHGSGISCCSTVTSYFIAMVCCIIDIISIASLGEL